MEKSKNHLKSSKNPKVADPVGSRPHTRAAMVLRAGLLFAAGVCLTSYLYGTDPPSGTPASRLLAVVGPALGLKDRLAAPSITLRYFDIRGRAEPIRLYLSDLGLQYTEVAFQSSDWRSRLKKEWTEQGLTPFGQVPSVSVGGLHLVQSQTIMRYIARRFDSENYGSNPDVDARIEWLAEGTEDIRKLVMKIKYDRTLDDAARTAQYGEHCSGPAIEWLQKYERLVPTQGFLVGSSRPSFADFLLFDLVDIHEALCPGDTFPALMEKLPLLRGLQERVRARPGVGAYLASEQRRDYK